MSALPQPRFTYEQYVAKEQSAETKSEFYRGEVFAMAGGSIRHNDISGNIFAELKALLRNSSCRPSNSDQRVRVPANGLATYPDVSVVCGPREVHPDDDQAITNPTVVFEVLSKSTEAYDRGKKFALFRELESLEQYVLVSQDEQRIECYSRRDDGSWLFTVSEGAEGTLELDSINARLQLSEIYADIDPNLESEQT